MVVYRNRGRKMCIRQKNKLAIQQKNRVQLIALFIIFSLLCLIMAAPQAVFARDHEPYTAYILNNDSKARMGEPFILLLGLTPETLPMGYSLSTLIDVLESPAGTKPEILTGFPKSRVTLGRAGTYRFSVRVSLMSKSSCGGIDAEEIMNQELRLQVVEP